jgi:hypothetical protein
VLQERVQFEQLPSHLGFAHPPLGQIGAIEVQVLDEIGSTGGPGFGLACIRDDHEVMGVLLEARVEKGTVDRSLETVAASASVIQISIGSDELGVK